MKPVIQLLAVAGKKRKPLRLLLLGPILFGLMLGLGCSKAAHSSGKTAESLPARMTIVNLAGYEWNVAVFGSTGEAVQNVHLNARASTTIKLPGGDYVIEQRMVTVSDVSLTPRRLPVRLEGGKDYRWELATLLSDPAQETTAGGSSHE